MRKFSILYLLVALISCKKDPISRQVTNNTDIRVDYLFEKDGCKVYRFRDYGQPVYFTNCSGKTQSRYDVDENETRDVQSITIRKSR